MMLLPTVRVATVAHLFTLAAAACSGGRPAPPPVAPPSAQEPETGVSPSLREALTSPARTDRERARDAARHPAETLAFCGVREDSSVLELWPGGGYYTAILAPLLAARGRLTVTHFDPAGDPKSEDTQEAQAIAGRLAKQPAVFGKVAERTIHAPAVDLGPEGSVDVVLTFRNVHNWIEEGYAEQVFAAAFRALRHAGVLGVEEHRGRPGMTVKEIKDTGYVPEEEVVRLAALAGFRLGARSEVNANPKDTKDYPQGVWSLPPTLAEHDANRARYEAIGESDRMTLRFVKP